MTDKTSCLADVATGRLRGFVQNGIRKFLGVPYAAPPVGRLRFERPQPVAEWSGIRDATVPGPTPAQQFMKPFGSIDNAPLMMETLVPGDDYLTLNLWRPDDARSGLPVMVFLYGGGCIIGSKDIPAIDGSNFARDGVISININYRVGLDGFMPIPGAATNIGLRDALASLQWVQDNIRAFGGDPTKVTLSGESGGAFCVACLLGSPLSKGLFSRVILQSGVPAARDMAVAQKIVKHLSKKLGVSPDVESYRKLPVERTLKAMEKLTYAGLDMRNANGVDPSMWASKAFPIHGDDVLPEQPMAAIAKGVNAEVELLISTCRNEMNFFTVSLGLYRWMPAWFAKWSMGHMLPNAVELLRAYGLGQKGISPGKAFTDAATDAAMRLPTRRLAEAHRGRTFIVEFDWHSPALGGRMGAAHAIVVPFVFDNLALVTGPRGVVGTNPPQQVADQTHGVWTRFIQGEEPKWPQFDAVTRQVYSPTKQRSEQEPLMLAAKYAAGG